MPYKDPIVQQAYMKSHRENFLSEGLCRCGKPRIQGKRACKECYDQYVAASRERDKSRKESGLCRQCGKNEVTDRARCSRCTEINRRHLQKLKSMVFAAYGNQCECCGETEKSFLTIDHVNDDGKEHRKSIRSNRIYHWLKKNGFPKDGFRLLCFNCNCGRRVNGGICPHKLLKS